MAIGTTAAILAAAGLAAGGSVAGAAMAGSAANRAADTQATAANTAAQANLDAAKYSSDAILQASREANLLQAIQYAAGQEETAPWREVGGGALMTLQDLMQPEGYLAEGYPEFYQEFQQPQFQGEFQAPEFAGDFQAPEFRGDFQAPEFNAQFDFDPSKVELDPGFEFRMAEGQKALERSAAAKGGVLSGAALKEAMRFSQGLASDEYGRAYERQYGAATDKYARELTDWQRRYGVETDEYGRAIDTYGREYGAEADEWARAGEEYGRDYGAEVDEWNRASETYGREYGAEADRYNRGLEGYRTNYAVDTANKGTLWDRLSSLAGYGGSAASGAANLGSQFATQVGQNQQNAAQQSANAILGGQRYASDANQNAAAARASGYVGASNAWTGALGNLTQLPFQYLSLADLLRSGGGSTSNFAGV